MSSEFIVLTETPETMSDGGFDKAQVEEPQKRTIVRWSTEDISLLLNRLDYCLIHKESYKATIVAELQKAGTSRGVTWAKIWDRLRVICKDKLKQKADRHDLLENGTRNIPVKIIPKEWLGTMNKQRQSWGIPPLGEPFGEIHASNALEKLQTSTSLSGARLRSIEASNTTRNSVDTDRTTEDADVPHGQRLNGSNTQKGLIRQHMHRHEPYRRSQMAVLRRVGDFVQEDATISWPHINWQAQERRIGTEIHSPTPSLITVMSERDAQELRVIPKSGHQGDPHPALAIPISGNRPETIILPQHMVIWLLARLQSGENMGTEECRRLISIHKTTREPEDVFAKLVEDLIAADKSKATYRDLVNQLRGPSTLLEKIDLPGCPSVKAIDIEWRSVRDGLRATVGAECSGQLPPPTILIALATRVDILSLGHYREDFLTEWVKYQLAVYPANRCIVQALMSNMFYRWLFAWPDLSPNQDHSGKINKLYELLCAADGISAVRHNDVLATKFLFEDSKNQNEDIPTMVRKLHQRLVATMQAVLPSVRIAAFDEFRSWLEQAVRLKQRLLISPKEYCIRSFQPGERFSADWMEAEGESGHPISDPECVLKTVKLCVFPAISQQDIEPLGEDAEISAALAVNKPFFRRRPCSTDVRISKAIVLVE